MTTAAMIFSAVAAVAFLIAIALEALGIDD